MIFLSISQGHFITHVLMGWADFVRQSYKNLEIICVDDGSTDGSPQILDAYARKDSRIKVLHKENGGLVSARKYGIAEAAGVYAGYVDSDDWIEADMYECLYQAALDSNADMITCGYYLDGSYTTTHLDNVSAGLYSDEKISQLRENTIYRLKSRETGIRGGLWCKLFRTNLLKEVQKSIPEDISIAEDKICVLKYILECSSAYVLKKPLYHWCIRKNSMSHENKNSYLLKVQPVYEYLYALYDHPNFSKTMCLQAEIYIVELLVLGINKRMGFKNKNMLWIDPYWLDKLPQNAKDILYGAGELGEKYRKQMKIRPDLNYLFCVDARYQDMSSKEFPVDIPQKIFRSEFDYIVITIKNRAKAMQIREELVMQNIPEEKIVWCEQPEAYWRYLRAEGILSDEDD